MSRRVTVAGAKRYGALGTIREVSRAGAVIGRILYVPPANGKRGRRYLVEIGKWQAICSGLGRAVAMAKMLARRP